jgi:hypothetical protein
MAKNKHNAKVGSTVERSDDRIKSTGEVFTPMELVYEMIDEISDEIMQDKTKTFLDNSCGSGNFLFGLYTRLTEKYGTPTRRQSTVSMVWTSWKTTSRRPGGALVCQTHTVTLCGQTRWHTIIVSMHPPGHHHRLTIWRRSLVKPLFKWTGGKGRLFPEV